MNEHTAILCPCGRIVTAPVREDAWMLLEEHQAVCGTRGFEAMECGADTANVIGRVEQIRAANRNAE